MCFNRKEKSLHACGVLQNCTVLPLMNKAHVAGVCTRVHVCVYMCTHVCVRALYHQITRIILSPMYLGLAMYLMQSLPTQHILKSYTHLESACS